MMSDLFDALAPIEPAVEPLADGAVLLRRMALDRENELLEALGAILTCAPPRHMTTPGGFVMSVATTSCGAVGWVTDRSGYRYDPIDPGSGLPWPAMPMCFAALAADSAKAAGYPDFTPDACLINRYAPGARLSLHQDRNERDFAKPIVSVSLGLPATFQFGGLRRNDPVRRIALLHGDVVVWGGPSRLRFHGVLPLKEDEHAMFGRTRINLTFRMAR